MSSQRCYICGHTKNAITAEGLSFHIAPAKITRRHILEQWLKFLHLPDSSMWPDQKWREIALCSLHFKEEDYLGRHVCMRRFLADNAVPTRNRPPGPGPMGEIFSLRAEINTDQIETEEDDWQYESYVSGDPTVISDAFSYKQVLQDARKELCRLCGQKGAILQPIFDPSSSETDKDVSLTTKMEMYLPFKIKGDDPLPHQICTECCEVLDRWHKFYVTSVAADAVLWKTFDGESDVCPKSQDSSTNRWDTY